MNDANAFEAWWNDYTSKIDLFSDEWQDKTVDDHSREAWQAACEWRDSQVGEPVAWAATFNDGELCELFQDLETLKLWMVSEDCMWDVKITPLYTTPPAAQINQQLVDALQNLLESALKYKLEPSDLCVEDAKAALAAAKETK